MPRDATNTPASHTSALGELFIADEWGGVQAKVYEFGSLRRNLCLPGEVPNEICGGNLDIILGQHAAKSVRRAPSNLKCWGRGCPKSALIPFSNIYVIGASEHHESPP